MEDLKNKLPFPVKQELSKEFLQKNFWKCLYTSASDELNYWMILPNNVKPVKLEPSPINDIGLTNIGKYVRVDESPYLEVQVVYEHNPYEMNASDWIEKKLYIIKEEIINFRLINGKSTGEYLDALTYKKYPNGEEIISRLTVFKDFDKKKGGANYFCIMASCPLSDYEQLSNHIFQIVANWDLINKTDWQMAENLKPFVINFTEEVKFYVPFSWDITYDVKNTSSNSRFVFTHNIGDKNKGVINAYFYEMNAFKDVNLVLKKSIKRLTDLSEFKSELSDILKTKTSNPAISEFYTSNGLFTYEIENFTSFAQVMIIKTDKGWYYFESIGPKPNLENYYWEINKRCMEIIHDSFNNLEFKKQEVVLKTPNLSEQTRYIIIEDEIRRRRSWWGKMFE